MKSMSVRAILTAREPQDDIRVQGWVRTKREAKGFSFLEVNDGSVPANVQVVVDGALPCHDLLTEIHTGASVQVQGDLVASPGKGQAWEIKARDVELIGSADPETYPLQKKRHTDEFLRGIAHLRPRTNKYGSMLRIRSELSFAVHDYFRTRGFFYLHAPIITGSDCEGAGEMFRVTTFDLTNVPIVKGEADFSQDFFGRPASLTVSGQLAAENAACALGKVYTFGPTFRAENSNTPRHAAEFWMIEPEVAFAELTDIIDLGEDFIKAMLEHLLSHCGPDLDLFSSFVDKGLMPTLRNILDNGFVRIPYQEAVDILQNSGREFEFPVLFGVDLQTEHERYLTEEHFKKPVAVYDYPKDIKAFYMRLNDDGETVAAVDILVPRIGELIGGSQREERLDKLRQRIREMDLDEDDYWWYLDLRRFGTVPHAGFGLGFERLLMLATGITNIRDVIPFPRTVRHLEF